MLASRRSKSEIRHRTRHLASNKKIPDDVVFRFACRINDSQRRLELRGAGPRAWDRKSTLATAGAGVACLSDRHFHSTTDRPFDWEMHGFTVPSHHSIFEFAREVQTFRRCVNERNCAWGCYPGYSQQPGEVSTKIDAALNRGQHRICRSKFPYIEDREAHCFFESHWESIGSDRDFTSHAKMSTKR